MESEEQNSELESDDFEAAMANMKLLEEQMEDIPDWAAAILEEHFWDLLL